MRRALLAGSLLALLSAGCTTSMITFKGDCDVPPNERVRPCIVEAQEYYVRESVSTKGAWVKQYYPRNSQTQVAHDVLDAIGEALPLVGK